MALPPVAVADGSNAVIPVALIDATGNIVPMPAVKAGGVAATGTDTASVVTFGTAALLPLAQTNLLVTNAALAANGIFSAATFPSGYGSILLQMNGTLVNAVNPQQSLDNITYYSVQAYNLNTRAWVTSVNTPGLYYIPSGPRWFQLNSTGFAAGAGTYSIFVVGYPVTIS